MNKFRIIAIFLKTRRWNGIRLNEIQTVDLTNGFRWLKCIHYQYIWDYLDYKSSVKPGIPAKRISPTGCGLYFLMTSAHIHRKLIHAWRRHLLPLSIKMKENVSKVDPIEGAPGFEPRTIRSAVECSTTELCPLFTRTDAIIFHSVNVFKKSSPSFWKEKSPATSSQRNLVDFQRTAHNPPLWHRRKYHRYLSCKSI